MRFIVLFIVLLVFWFAACDNTGPSYPNFPITSIEFTGDSTGLDQQSRGAGSVPYCEFTIEWDAPLLDTRFEYKVYRSQEPGIESNPESAEELTLLQSTSWVDSEELEWNTGYYYAVKAVPSQGGDRWSNEILVQTPTSPFPTPGELSYEKFLFKICFLSWEACSDSGFQSACLLRSLHEDIEHSYYPRDTLLITTDHSAGQFTDSTIVGRDPRYYVLAVSAGEDIVSYSNEVCFSPGVGIPWFLDKNFEIGNANLFAFNNFGLISKDSRTVYFHYVDDYTAIDVVNGIVTSSGSSCGHHYFDRILGLAERPDGTILVTYRDDDQSYHMCSLSKDLSSVLQTIDFNRAVSSLLETPAGILCTSENKLLVLDPVSFEIVDSLLPPFIAAVSFDNLNRSFLMTSSSVKALRSSDLENMGYINGSFTNIQAGLDGNLYCFSEAGVEWYDAGDLSLQGNYSFPTNTFGATVLPGKEYLVYVYHRPGTGGDYFLDIHDMRNGEILGTVEDVPNLWDTGVFLFPSWDGDFLWGFLGGNALSLINCFCVTL
ncbi:MAG: hypothetical protein KAH31_10535 [Candidatus Sabulitectum sp.]|nr:hypothetical protein [Candidatus Sabulitectum sp.]